MVLARSVWRKGLVTLVAAVGIVALYEATMLDSKATAPGEAMREEVPAPQPGARLTFQATAYCKGETTAAGVRVQAGSAAADPKVLPLGSIIESDTRDSRYDGIYTVLDTGPKVQGTLLDIYMWSCHEALDFGRQPIRVHVLRRGWNPRATAPGFIDRLFSRAGRSGSRPATDAVD
jgi:3D (Asp-Asp-Asp) domain-containing protein